MKRKVIKQGNGTLTITLPKEWSNRIGIQGGDEIEIEDKGNQLFVTPEQGKTSIKMSMNIDDIESERALKWFLGATNKRGYDEIELFFSDPKMVQRIQSYLPLYTGFGIIEQSKNRVLVKAMTLDSYDELEPSLRRSFRVTLTLADELIAYLKRKDYSLIKDLTYLENTNNQFTNLAERLLTKIGYKEREKTSYKYIIVWNTECICDNYRDLCYIFHKCKKVAPEYVSMLEELTSFFKEFSDFIYSFSIPKHDKLHKKEVKLRSKLENMFPKDKTEMRILFLYHELLQRILDYSGSIICLEL